MAEHTPTPWKAFHTEIRDTSGHEMSVARMSILAGAGIRNGKVESYSISDEEAYANATHIVKCVNAFPDLVKALEEIAELYSGGHAKKIARDVLDRVKSPGGPDHG